MQRMHKHHVDLNDSSALKQNRCQELAVQIIAKEIDNRLERLKRIQQGLRMQKKISQIQDMVFQLSLVKLGVPISFLEPQLKEKRR